MSFVFLGQDIESCIYVLSEECSIVRVGAPASGGSPQSVAVCVCVCERETLGKPVLSIQ